VDLQERLKVQVRHLILVADAEELRESGVGEDATLERGVEARVRLHVLADELRHLSLRARLARLETHEVAQLLRQGALDQEGVVRATLLPSRALLRSHRRRVNLLLLLGIASLALGGLRRLLDSLHGIADTSGELRAERLEGLRQGHELRLRGHGRGRGNRLSGRRDNSRHRDLSLRGRGGLDSLDLRLSLGSSSGDNNGGGGGLRGIGLLGSRHLV